MKKFVVLMCSAILLLCLSCETSNKNSQAIKEIEEEIATANSICPQEVAKHVTLTSVKFQNNTVIYDYLIDVPEDKVDLVMEQAKNIEAFKEGLIYMLKGEAQLTPTNKRFFDNLIDVSADMEYRYHNNSRDLYSISISSSEIKNALQL